METPVEKVRKPIVISKNEEKDMSVKISKFFGMAFFTTIVFVFGILTGRLINGDITFFGKKVDIPDSNKVSFSGNTTGKGEVGNEVDFDLYWEVWNSVQSEYVDVNKVDQKKMFYDSVKGLVNSYGDPATAFFTPEETEAFNNQSAGKNFSGIGAELGYRNGEIIIVTPIKGSPAAGAGVMPGDKILAVDGKDVTPEQTVFDLVMVIRGERGTDVTLTLLRDGVAEPLDISITRDDIVVPSMEFYADESGEIAVIDVARFTEASPEEWERLWNKTIDQVVAGGYKGVIIDLRGNPGGYMSSAIHAAEDFLGKDTVIIQQEDRQGDRLQYKVDRKGKLLDMPVVVLVNEGSASASEILAGALQKNERATIIGESTFGKGTAQSVLQLSDNSSLHVTIYKWLLPDGQWLSPENPIKPDVEVELSLEDFENGRDPQFDKAIEHLKSK